MNTIKSRAHHTAWRASRGSMEWNPWARRISRTSDSLSDEENPDESLNAVHYSRALSEACLAAEAELAKIPGGLHGPVRAATMPLPRSTSTELPRTAADGAGGDIGKLIRRKPIKTDNDEEEEPEGRDRPIRVKRLRRITPWSQFKDVMFGNWFNILFVFVPVGFGIYYAQANPIVVFCVNFIALIPSIMTLDYALEELISSILLLKSRQIIVLQATLLGNILSNLLFMTGLSFICGGMKNEEQHFNGEVAHTISTFLLLASLSVVVPTVSHFLTEVRPGGIIAQSRGPSIIILISYGLWLLFQNKTHRDIFDITPKEAKPWGNSRPIKPGEVEKRMAAAGASTAAAIGGRISEGVILSKQDDENEEEEGPVLTLIGGILATVFSTALIGFHSEFATNSIQGLCQQAHISQKFVGLVILPILSFDHSAAVVATKNKMDMSISLTLERCMQTSLLVVPIVVLLAWCMGINDMTLEFDGFSTASLFGSNIIVSYVVQQGKANWLTGALLIKIYLIIAIAAFFET